MADPNANAGTVPSPSDLGEIETALAAGRAPRSGRDLQIWHRALANAGDIAGAVRCLNLLARLELRRDNRDQALRRLRAAERLSRTVDPCPPAERTLDLLAAVYSEAGEHDLAIRAARALLDRARRRGDAESAAAGRRRLVESLLTAGRYAQALETAGVDDPRGAASDTVLRATAFLESGCATEAERLLTAVLRQNPAPDEAPLLRGRARLVLGNPAGAARDFRKALARAKQAGDPRVILLSQMALAAAQLAQAADGQSDARRLRAEAVRDRMVRRARRTRDPFLLESAKGLFFDPVPAETVAEMGARLVALSRETESEAVIEACIREVSRLGGRPATAPAFHFPVGLRLRVSP